MHKKEIVPASSKYSQTCLQRPPWGRPKCGFRADSLYSKVNQYVGQRKVDLYSQEAVITGLTVAAGPHVIG